MLLSTLAWPPRAGLGPLTSLSSPTAQFPVLWAHVASELSFDLTAFARGKNEASGTGAGASSAPERLHARVHPARWAPPRGGT